LTNECQNMLTDITWQNVELTDRISESKWSWHGSLNGTKSTLGNKFVLSIMIPLALFWKTNLIPTSCYQVLENKPTQNPWNDWYYMCVIFEGCRSLYTRAGRCGIIRARRLLLSSNCPETNDCFAVTYLPCLSIQRTFDISIHLKYNRNFHHFLLYSLSDMQHHCHWFLKEFSGSHLVLNGWKGLY
jgi:hypothetical protein